MLLWSTIFLCTSANLFPTALVSRLSISWTNDVYKICKMRWYLPKHPSALTSLTVFGDQLQNLFKLQSPEFQPPNDSKMCRMLTNSDLFGFRYGKILDSSQTFSERTTLKQKKMKLYKKQKNPTNVFSNNSIHFKTQNLKQILEFVSKVFSFTLCKYEFWADEANWLLWKSPAGQTWNSDTSRYRYRYSHSHSHKTYSQYKTEPLTLLGLFGTSSGVSHFTAHVLHIF